MVAPANLAVIEHAGDEHHIHGIVNEIVDPTGPTVKLSHLFLNFCN